MREFDTSKLPPELLPLAAQIRNQVFAVNERISDVYRSEEKDKDRAKERGKRLESAVRVSHMALELFRDLNFAVAKYGVESSEVGTGPNIKKISNQLGL